MVADPMQFALDIKNVFRPEIFMQADPDDTDATELAIVGPPPRFQ